MYAWTAVVWWCLCIVWVGWFGQLVYKGGAVLLGQATFELQFHFKWQEVSLKKNMQINLKHT